MKTDTYKIKIEFITEILGSQPADDVASRFIAKRNGMEEIPQDELDAMIEDDGSGQDGMVTRFHKDKFGHPLLFDYQIKGFMKNAAQVLNGKDGLPKALKSKVNNLVFISPRSMQIKLPNGSEMSYCERSLRAETMRGPRVALAKSEMLPEKCVVEFGLTVLPGEISQHVLEELLDYGYYQGLGQWRNGGYGRFRYELTREE